MKSKLLAIPLLVACGAAILGVATATAQEGPPPPPSAGEVLVSGLSSTGAAIGPDGAIYVAVAGIPEAGDTQIVLPPEFAEEVGGEIGYFGLHSKVVRVDPVTGATTDYEGLPSAGTEPGESGVGPADVAFIGDRLYALVTGGANYAGGPAADYPNGIYRLNDDSSWSLVADLSQFNDANPVAFDDAGSGGNPFALDVRNGEFIVSDGNFNRLLIVNTDGDARVLASFDNVVPTGLATHSDGPVLLTWFSAFPHAPEDSHLVQLAYPTGGNVTQIAGGYAQLIDVEFGPGGRTYVLQFGDQQIDENGPPPPGRLLVLEDGELVPLVTGLFVPTSVNFNGDTAYITSLSGDLLKIENVSALTPLTAPAPAPATAPPPAPAPPRPAGAIRPPDTGMGTGVNGSPMTLWAVVLVSVAGAAFLGGAAVVTRK